LLLDDFSPTNIKPTNDYYNFINFQWLKQIKLTEQQKYLTQIDDFRLTQDKVYGQLNEIIVNYIKENDNKFARNMNNYYQSILKMNSPSSSRILSKQLVSDVNAMCQENNPWKMLAYFNKHRYCKFRCPFEFNIAADPKKSNIFCMNIDPHSFDILDLDVYFDDGTNVSYKEKTRHEYKRFCKELFDAMLGKGHGYNTDSIYEIEVEMFNAFNCKGFFLKNKESDDQDLKMRVLSECNSFHVLDNINKPKSEQIVGHDSIGCTIYCGKNKVDRIFWCGSILSDDDVNVNPNFTPTIVQVAAGVLSGLSYILEDSNKEKGLFEPCDLETKYILSKSVPLLGKFFFTEIPVEKFSGKFNYKTYSKL
jgi:hypothetical protein